MTTKSTMEKEDDRARHRESRGGAESLRPLLRPRSIAVIGASNRENSLGAAILRNLFELGFHGPIYPVHPKASFVHSTKAYPSLEAIPDEIDLAVIVVPRQFVEGVMQECASKKVKGVVVITAGYKETGTEGAKAEQRILEIARGAGIRLIGPNCMGIISTDPETRMDATFSPTPPPEGTVAIGTQSGALGVVMLEYARELNLGVSDFVSMGNKADVSSNDLLQWWENDPRTNVILLYLESFGNPRKFAALARRINHKKPIIAVKSGRSRKGLQAASSHTGSLAGADKAVEALLVQTGVIRVDTVDELFDTAAFLAHQPVPKGRRVGIVTNAGGPAILATDACEAWGLQMPDLDDSLKARLAEFLPKEASFKNPVDMIASAGAEEFEKATRVMLESDQIDALLVLVVRPIIMNASEIGRAVVRGAAGSNKPVLSCFMGRQGIPEALSSLKEAQIPSYAFPESAIRVLSRVARYGEWKERPHGSIPELPDFDRDKISAVLEHARARLGTEGGWLSPGEVDELLTHCGIATPVSRFARDGVAAREIARTIGFPVVMKVIAEGVEHKTDVGGVHVDIRNEDEVEQAFKTIRQSLIEHDIPPDVMSGVMIQPLIKNGTEAIVGASCDPSYGHLIMFGLGGVHVELLRDVAFRLAPMTDMDAKELVRGIRGYPLLDGFRGADLADVPKLEEIILRVSTLVSTFPEIQEMDLNPVKVLARGKGCVTVDARVRV